MDFASARSDLHSAERKSRRCYRRLGIVALEAAAAGCALVAADLEGLRDAVVDGEGGALVPAEDAAAWTTALLELLADPARAAQLGARARIWATAERSWDLICDRYEEISDQLAPDVG